MNHLVERSENERFSLQEFCRDILNTKLIPEELAQVESMKGKNTDKYVHKGHTRPDQVHRDNPFNIEATRDE